MVAVEGREAPLYVLMLLILCIQTSVIFIYFFITLTLNVGTWVETRKT